MTRTLKTLSATAALMTALVVTGCSSDDGMSGHQMPASSTTGPGTGVGTGQATGEAQGDHNPADVTFAASMVPHHQQAIEMADLALVRPAVVTSGDSRLRSRRPRARRSPR